MRTGFDLRRFLAAGATLVFAVGGYATLTEVFEINPATAGVVMVPATLIAGLVGMTMSMRD